MARNDDFNYKSQDVNYLGFLEAQLRDFQGMATLAYELIQNADDVQGEDGRSGATTITFDVTDQALIVENDGEFRPVDFRRMQSIASGGKRGELGATGAFGIGFIAVYQVTDAPEIFSGGRHWVIHPEAPPAQRIQEREAATEGTRFRLPWAFDVASPVRRALRASPIDPAQLDDYAARIGEAIELAALFLQRLQTLTVKRNGRLLHRIERIREEERLILRDESGGEQSWLLLAGDFAAAAEQLRQTYPWQIEAKRRHQVRLALPLHETAVRGRLFAVLPTESTMPLPGHVNADFFPTTDRRRIQFDDGYQAEWNRAAIRGAAQILANHLDRLRRALGPARFWHLLAQLVETAQRAGAGALPAVFAAFWQSAVPSLQEIPIFYTAGEKWRPPGEGRIVRDGASVPLLAALRLPVPHPALLPYLELMRRPEIAVPPLTISDVVAALTEMGLAAPKPLYAAPPFLRDLNAWQTLWGVIDGLLSRLYHPDEKAAALRLLKRPVLALTDRMELAHLNDVYRGTEEVKILFPDVKWAHDALDGDRFPGRYLSNFGVRQAVERLAETPVDRLEEAWRLGRLDLPRLFRWFESQQIEILADDPALRDEIRRLPLCPVDGELRPLALLYLPGGFEDPLRLAGIVNLDAIGGRRQFLRDLGVEELDFDTYVHREIPRVLEQRPDLPSDARRRLVRLLARRLGMLRDDQELRRRLAELPLIACLDGSFRPATAVYASREARRLLGEGAHVAEPVEDEAIAALHRWLGVRERPAPGDLAATLLAIGQAWEGRRLETAVLHRVEKCWEELNERLAEANISAETWAQLRDQPTLPNRRHFLARPTQLFFADREQLARRFARLDRYLAPAEAAYEEAARAAGVRSLAAAVEVEVVDGETAVAAPEIEARIAERRSLIERVLRAEEIPASPEFLDAVRARRIEPLQIRYRLSAAEKTLTSERETTPAKLLPGQSVLYVQGEPWAAIARELAQALQPGRRTAGLAVGIKEVLAAETAAAAGQLLDELGYP